jgi:glucokinase
VDVGGSSLKVACADAAGRVLGDAVRPTGRGTTVESLAARIRGASEELGYELGCARAIGVGVAGCVTLDGIVRGSPNLPGLAHVALERALGDALAARVACDNDAHCHARAEAWTGSARGEPAFLLLTLGSGIGSALVLDGAIHRGVTGYGSELGHMVLEKNGRVCACGHRGCVEAYVSEVGLRARIAEQPELAAAVERRQRGTGGGAAEELFALADAGDARALALVDAAVSELGTAIGSAVNVYDVVHVVIGGGMSPGFLARSEAILRATDAALFARSASEIRIVAASAGTLAGAVGAARLAMQSV